ncbi:MAG TPA: hypothetical protein ENJ24_05270 [Gammaproteobacteria bacterium]|nr:hypothetical protein [Gammaproteobacteria bacterium]
MILVCNEYFLNEEGRNYFPEWLQYLAKKLEKQQGFQGLRRLKEASVGADGCSLLLEFDNQEMLDRWLASEEHAEAVALLESYTLRPFSSSRYYAEQVMV